MEDNEFCIGEEHLAQAHKGAHDGDVDLHGTRTPQDAGEHRDALLREGVWKITRSALERSISRKRTKVRMMAMLTCTARELRRTLESIATPCSVKAYGR